ncbi:hypothetical protein [Blastococcus capsensis]|uniref:hypothetical protein n=1 Tax=Blastococcus capsensis TaxID=1564163 RepID=UPI00253F937C|nr:hypothetical protein [Blastococcus capsensis]MDK3258141.1 hypothetical protein [Blastococcus capsensis]
MSTAIPVLRGRGMTMSDQLARWSRTRPDAAALRFEGAGRSYAQLDERVSRLARRTCRLTPDHSAIMKSRERHAARDRRVAPRTS